MYSNGSNILELLKKDVRILFITRLARLFAYGSISVVLVLYLAELGFDNTEIGLLLTLTLIGDTVITLWITAVADRNGRRRMLILGALLMASAGLVFAASRNFAVLLIAATIGVISPSGYEVGPFLSIEQASLAQIVPDERRTQVFAWYNMVGSFATALGALTAGLIAQTLGALDFTQLSSDRVIVLGYGGFGLFLGLLFMRLSSAVEVPRNEATPYSVPVSNRFGLGKSKRVVVKLSALFSLDAFAGGFILQSIMAYWFSIRFHVQPALLGSIFFGANILAGVSSLAAARVASRFGLVNTMVFTHIPSQILLIMVPLMPNLPLAVTVLLLRFSISQMDVPTRQSYTMAVVDPQERSAAAGITSVARTIGASFAPVLAGPLLASAVLINMPFYLAGGIKLAYDLLLYRLFRAVKPPEEERDGR